MKDADDGADRERGVPDDVPATRIQTTSSTRPQKPDEEKRENEGAHLKGKVYPSLSGRHPESRRFLLEVKRSRPLTHLIYISIR